MALDRSWSRPSRKLAGLLLAVTVPPLVALVWLGALLVGEDRARVERRIQEERQVALRTVAQALDRSLIDLERHLTEGAAPPGLVRLTLSPDGVTADPGDRVLWLPASSVSIERESAFLPGEIAEHRSDAPAALEVYRRLLDAPDDATRAGALVRIARMHRNARRWNDALEHYRQLETMAHVRIAGAPADLQARRAICDVFAQAGRDLALARESAALRDDLTRGRWTLDRPTWELAAADITRWTGTPMPVERDRLVVSKLAAHLWPAELQATGDTTRRFHLVVDDAPFTLVARAEGENVAALVLPPQVVAAILTEAAATTALATGSVALRGDRGEAISGAVPDDADDVLTLSAADTGLPWAIVLGPEDTAVVTERLADRRWPLLLGFGTMLLFVAGSGVFLWRLVQREFAVSRLQTEFVSTVSHEFRTPLTSLRLAWEVLDEGDDVPADQRRSLYGAIGRNSERLQRLVESLLDFSRMEGGRKPYELVPLDAGALVRDVVADFRQQMPVAADVDVVVTDAGPFVIRGDRAALGHAIWNLLDNAVKYSPDGARVRVSVRDGDTGIAIAVADRGVGVPVAEQGTIFDRFVRGERARDLGVGGTGLGLAIVSHIVRAHHGRVAVSSSGKRGSTFTITVPRTKDEPAGVGARVSA
jgi:signal transduction histidine kinase